MSTYKMLVMRLCCLGTLLRFYGEGWVDFIWGV
jgi:hypothetical protein